MKLKVELTVSAIYPAILGVGFMLAPRQIGIDVVPADASPALMTHFLCVALAREDFTNDGF